MSANSSRPSSVRVTYLDRAKAKRNQMAIQDEEDSSDSTNEDAPQPVATPAPRKSVPSRPKSVKAAKSAVTPAKAQAVATPGKPRRKTEDVKPQPPPSVRSTRQTPKPAAASEATKPTPRRGRRDSLESRKTITRSASKPASTPQPPQTPARRASSVVSRRSKRLSSASNKPPSGRQSSRRGRAGDDDEEDDEDDEGGSDADSDPEAMLLAATGKIRRDVKDRQQYFSNQSDCAAFGPYRALCSRCKAFVNLSKHQTFAVAPWEKHRAKCDQELASDAQVPPNAEQQVNLAAEEIFTPAPVRRSATERQAVLSADNFAELVEESRIKCRNCSKWVALKKKKPYDLRNWQLHRDKCVKEIPPSDRPGDSEGKHDIVGELQDLVIDRGSNSATNVLEKNSVLFPATPAASIEPASSVHTKPSVAESEGSGSQTEGEPIRAAKRPRETGVEQASQDSDEAERPSNRPRKESTALDWLMLPFRSFVRGFRESLTFDDTSDVR